MLQNFTGMLATNLIFGSVKINSTNIVGVGVSAGQTIGGAFFWNWTHTDTSGNYVLNVGNGTWDLGVYCNAGGYSDGLDVILGVGNYLCPSDQSATINNSSATNNFVVQGCTGVSINTTSLPNGEVNLFYNQILMAGSCDSSFTWANPSGALPSGLNLDSASGTISGMPGASGPFNFTVQVTDGSNHSTNKTLSITIAPGVQITTASLPNGTNGAPYSRQLQASGGALPYQWTLASGGLPANLNLATTGLLSGAPTTSGTFNFTAQVTDALGGTWSQGLGLTIAGTNNYPPLTAGTGGGQILVYWPLSAGTNYTVETTTNVATGPWVTATDGMPVIALTFTNRGSPAFFRLH